MTSHEYLNKLFKEHIEVNAEVLEWSDFFYLKDVKLVKTDCGYTLLIFLGKGIDSVRMIEYLNYIQDSVDMLIGNNIIDNIPTEYIIRLV